MTHKNMDIRQSAALLGGYNLKLITTTGSEVTLPGGCVAIIPNPGCVFTSLKRSDNTAINWADSSHFNYATYDLGTDRKTVPIVAIDPYFWSYATISAGDFYTICV